MKTLEVPSNLTELQKELLKLYAAKVSDEDLYQIKLMIGNYFAEKATNSIDLFLDEKKITIDNYNDWANEHNRAANNY